MFYPGEAVRTVLDCIPCFLTQALRAARVATDDESAHERVLRRVLVLESEMDFASTPPEMAAQIHEIVRDETGDPDPFRPVKQRFTRFALGLLPQLSERVASARDPFEAALRVAIAGNIIDFGLRQAPDEAVVLETIEDALERPLAIDDVASLRAAAERARTILYLADNAGEVVLDRLLLERLPVDRVTVVVRGGPVINDAVMADADDAGLTSRFHVIDSGDAMPGTVLSRCSRDFQQRFASAELVISKGQGNFETLSDVDREIYHLFKVKCPIAALDVGCAVGEIVAHRRGGTR